jgi:hypothetical protein
MSNGQPFNWEGMTTGERGKPGNALYRKLNCCLCAVCSLAISSRYPKDSPSAHKGLITKWLHHSILQAGQKFEEPEAGSCGRK